MQYLKNNKNFYIKTFEIIFIQSWWVVLFLFICFIGYDIGIKKRSLAIFKMKSKYDNLIKEKQIVLNKKEDLQLRVHSQSDPAWIESVLMKELGVVPENKIKVHFKK